MKFSIGADPELFLTSICGKNLVSAINILTGTKYNQTPLPTGTVHYDNVAAEITTHPSASKKEFIENMKGVLQELSKLIGNNRLLVQASADFPIKELDHPDAIEFGCAADYDAYALVRNVIKVDPEKNRFRSAGGHIHIGTDGTNEKLKFLLDPYGKIDMVKAMDVIFSISAILIDHDKTSKARRALYGKAGAHRPTDYGVEYRTPSNFWIASPKLVSIAYDLTAAAINICAKEKINELIDRIGGEDIVQEIINEHQKEKAIDVFNKIISNVIPKSLSKSILFFSKNKSPIDILSAWQI